MLDTLSNFPFEKLEFIKMLRLILMQFVMLLGSVKYTAISLSFGLFLGLKSNVKH